MALIRRASPLMSCSATAFSRPRRPIASGARRVGHERLDRGGERVHVVRFDEEPGLAVRDKRRRGPGSGRDDRGARGHRFERRQPEALVAHRRHIET